MHQLLEWTIIRPVYKVSYRGILWNLESTEISVLFSQCSCIDITVLNVEILHVKCVAVIRSAYLRAQFFSQNIHVLFLNSHSHMYHTSRPLTQNNMQVQQMGPQNCSLPAHYISSCCMVHKQLLHGACSMIYCSNTEEKSSAAFDTNIVCFSCLSSNM